MYVIYPADELILFTYGNINLIPKHRPTLDRIRDPEVAIDEYNQQHQHPSHQCASYTSPTFYSHQNSNGSRKIEHATQLSNSLRQAISVEDRHKRSSAEVERRSASRARTPTSLLPPRPPASNGSRQASTRSSPLRHLLNLHPDRRSKSPDCSTATRVKESVQIRIANPTFTRDNLRNRNFEAFFKSGEPVVTPSSPQDVTDNIKFSATPPSSAVTTPSSPSSHKGFNNIFKTALHSSAPSTPLTTPKSLNDRNYQHFTGSFEKESTPKPQPSGRGFNLIRLRGRRSRSVSVSPATPGGSPISMASADGGALRDLVHPQLNDALRNHNGHTFKLVKTVSDFTESLSQLYEAHAESLQDLVSNYRKKNADLRKERPACQSTLFSAWECFLQEVEADSQGYSDIANTLARQVSRPLLERSFYRKVQSRKIFSNRESFDTIIAKTEEKLTKTRMNYKNSYMEYRASPGPQQLTLYCDAHNTYVQQLRATNAMLDAYHSNTLPLLMQELEEIYNDLCRTLSDSLVQGSEIISTRSTEQSKRYDGLSGQCRSISANADLQQLCKALGGPPPKVPRKHFLPPQAQAEEDTKNSDNVPPSFKNDVVLENTSMDAKEILQALRREATALQGQIQYLQDGVDALIRTQSRALESQLFNKVNEIQETLSAKEFDLRSKQLHLAAINAQKELLQGKIDAPLEDSKMSNSGGATMKSKWLKAFRSLKPTNSQSDRKISNDVENVSHFLQEYTYKKITPCDVCSEVLRGHTKQGLRCKTCKANTHVDCASRLPRCQSKARLLRRQRSTSEIEPTVEDQTPHSPRRHKLDLRMKSLSLDSPESSELHAQRRRITPPNNNSRMSSPSSPSSKRLLGARGMRTGSVDLPDQELERSLSSASTSPCPSPVRYVTKPHRLLPTNLYAVLYNFQARHQDELDLRAGYKVTVIDSSDPDWWKGKCLGRVGFFPSKYCTRLQAGEKVLQVTHNVQTGDRDPLTLLRDQIVVQVGEENKGLVSVRVADRRTGMCPVKYLLEV